MTYQRNYFDFNGMQAYSAIGSGLTEWAYPVPRNTNGRMERFSDELRGERERRRIPLEKISEETKISSRHLLALEAGEYSSLPGGVFRKGIVRSYLRAVGLEESPWIERFEASLRESGSSGTEDDWAEFAENVRRNRSGARQAADIRWVGVAVMVAALIALGWIVWRFAMHERLF
ncbi:hypothetical protein GCM10011507_19300 [Edaphobacter acidisoli]|uniref:Helix-turn-helix domain-containing protein n=1 Tax=Edaphobacter acidisoli TaxID=2040573 RepID=A0A916RUI3_9BACT|nr:helix-turn-helix domain-containing protein [Edaphobacter acidisoli]GGA67975.1 hypothetical protein GCM10011507_19300 [Edaphobacter acidisoli]